MGSRKVQECLLNGPKKYSLGLLLPWRVFHYFVIDFQALENLLNMNWQLSFAD